MKLIILAGGFGTRISEETDVIPKPMVLIGNKPILLHIIKYYSSFGIKEFIICGGYKFKIIHNFFKKFNKKNNLNVKVINTGIKSNTGERLKKIKNYCKEENFCLTYGDGLSNVNIEKLIKFHKKKKSIVTLTAVKPIPHFGKIEIKGNKVVKFSEKDPKKENWINGGFFVCNKSVFSFLNKPNPIFESHTLNLLSKKKKLSAFKHKSFWYCMDTLRDKRYLNKLWEKNIAPWKIWNE